MAASQEHLWAQQERQHNDKTSAQSRQLRTLSLSWRQDWDTGGLHAVQALQHLRGDPIYIAAQLPPRAPPVQQWEQSSIIAEPRLQAYKVNHI